MKKIVNLILTVFLTLSPLLGQDTISILSTPMNQDDFIGFKMHRTEEIHKFFIEYRGIREANPKSITQALKREFLDTRSLHVVYTMSDQYRSGVYVIFNNNITEREVIAKVKAAIRKEFLKKFEEATNSIGSLIKIQMILDMYFGRKYEDTRLV